MIGEIGQLRVKVRPEYFPLYQQLLKQSYFSQHSDLFTLCCMMSPTNVKEGRDTAFTVLCQASSFTSYQLTVLSALGYKKIQKLVPYKELFEYMEQVADQGIKFLIEEIWEEVVTVNEDGEVTILPGREMEAQMLLSEYVKESLEEAPF